jgi:hypothetical protein
MFSPKHISRVTAVALVAGGVAVPAASAMPITYSPPTHLTAPAFSGRGSHPFGPNRSVPVATSPVASPTYSRQDKQVVPSSPTQAPVTATPTVVRVSNPGGGFDWGDAAIGAGAGIGLSILGIGGAFALQRRSRKPAIGTSASAVATG